MEGSVSETGAQGKSSAEGGEGEDWGDATASQDTLDLTGHQLKDLAGIPIHSTLSEVDLTTNRLTVIDPAICQLTGLKKLILRQNLLQDAAVEELSKYPALGSLEELVLRDNQLKEVLPVSNFPSLLILDLSWNQLKTMAGLSHSTTTLQELSLSANLITKIEEIGHLSNLRLLELGCNKIRVMEGLEGLKNLQELWLGRNKIRSLDLCGLCRLVKVSVQSNRLTSMAGFEGCVLLEELYLSHNGIGEMADLSPLVGLRVLDVSSNRIHKIEGVNQLTRLEDFWCNDNRVESLEGIGDAFAGSRLMLTTIYLESNPCAKDQEYVPKLRAALPRLTQVDALELK